MPRKTTRRGKNEGTIYQRKDGVWCGQILLGYKLDGKPHRKTVYGKTREEVARKVTNVSHESFNGLTPTENTNVTVGQFVMGWLTNFKRAEVELCTYEFYLSTVKTHIIPLLGNIQLTKLSTYQI